MVYGPHMAHSYLYTPEQFIEILVKNSVMKIGKFLQLTATK